MPRYSSCPAEIGISLADIVRIRSTVITSHDVTARLQQKCLIKEQQGHVKCGMSEFPVQLRWTKFVSVLRRLGYNAVKSGRGSRRVFVNPARTPSLVVFYEPHSGDTLNKATLHDSVRKLGISSDQFVRLLQ